MDLKSKSDSQLRNMLNKDSGYSANEVRSILTEMKSRGLETPPASMVTGGRKAKDVNITLPTPKPKTQAKARGGMAKKKMMGGGMMQYSKGTGKKGVTVQARGCGLARKKPTKMS